MNDSFLTHYNSELLAIRRAAAEFAAEHPRIAGRLRVSADAVEDPSVGRLIESFAFLTARVRQKLDDDFPELTDALSGCSIPIISARSRPCPCCRSSRRPIYRKPTASRPGRCSIPSRSRGKLPLPHGLSCGPSSRRADRGRAGEPPLSGALRAGGGECRLVPAPDAGAERAGARLAEVAPKRLRVFLRGQPSLTYELHELLLNDALMVAFANGPNDPAPVVMEASALSPVGFGTDEGLLLYPENAHAGYRLLTEFFVFPEKFLFVDLELPDAARLTRRHVGSMSSSS